MTLSGIWRARLLTAMSVFFQYVRRQTGALRLCVLPTLFVLLQAKCITYLQVITCEVQVSGPQVSQGIVRLSSSNLILCIRCSLGAGCNVAVVVFAAVIPGQGRASRTCRRAGPSGMNPL